MPLPPATLCFPKPWSPIHICKSDYFIFNLIGIGNNLFQMPESLWFQKSLLHFHGLK